MILLLLAETVGFEPTEQVTSLDGLASRCRKPLGYVSVLLLLTTLEEGARFELARFLQTGFAIRCLQPLSHPSRYKKQKNSNERPSNLREIDSCECTSVLKQGAHYNRRRQVLNTVLFSFIRFHTTRDETSRTSKAKRNSHSPSPSLLRIST